MKTKLFRHRIIDFLSIYYCFRINNNVELTNLLLDLGEDFDNSDLASPDNYELILDFYRDQLKGVTNYFLQKEIFSLTGFDIEIIGHNTILVSCCCCGYRTLEERGDYEICEVCKWEDVGIIEDSLYSSPNRMTLLEAKKKFAEQVKKGKIDSSLLFKYSKDY